MMVVRLMLVLVMLAGLLSVPVEAADSLSILYLGRDQDRAYKARRGYTGLSLRDVKRPIDGARLSIKSNRVLARAIGIEFSLEERILDADDKLSMVLDEEIAEPGRIVLADLDRDEMQAVIEHTKARDDVIVFNIRHRGTELRQHKCAPQLFHTIPSHAMLADALAQFLVAKRWRRVLRLVGEQPADSSLADAFAASSSKFGVRIVASKPFVLSNDPRQRAKNNLVLLSSDSTYDAVFLADSLGEFGRLVPYGIAAPRPIVGSEGLSAVTWHWTLERYGAPQLNQRFYRQIKRRMSSLDWAAWVAVRSVVEAARQTKTASVKPIRQRLIDKAFQLDLYKGFPGSYRPWSRQLRQPIPLATHNAVIGLAPIDGFEHRLNVLDTLGVDAEESTC